MRPVWRLENGRAVLIAYEIYRGPKNQYGKIPGVLGRSEFGLEIVIEIAYLVYIVGLSFDKVCLLLNFFQNLKLRKVAGRRPAESVVAALGERVRRAVHAAGQLVGGAYRRDELESEQRVGVSLGEGACAVLRRAQGCGDAEGRFSIRRRLPASCSATMRRCTRTSPQSQKCWAHLLRKAIKLTLQEPDNAEYRSFTDRLLEIYREACRVQRDRRLGDAGRAQKVAVLEDEILASVWADVGCGVAAARRAGE